MITLVCTIHVIYGAFLSTATVEGIKLSENKTQYYVDFTKDLVKNDWSLESGNDGKTLVLKDKCVKINKGNN